MLFILALSLLQLLVGVTSIILHGTLWDFSIYYSYAKLFLSGVNPYSLPTSLNYPPSALFFFLPFAYLSFTVSEIVFTLFSVGFFLTTALIFMGSSGIKQPQWKFFILAVLLQLFPTKFTLGMGQINLIVLGFLFLVFHFDKKDKNITSGLVWGVSSMLKIIPLPLGLYFLAKKKWKSFFGGIALFLAGNALFFLFFDFSIYLTHQLPSLFMQTTTSTSPYDQSLRAFLTRLGMENTAMISVMIIGFLTVLTVYLYYRQKNKADNVFFCALLVLGTIGGSFTWQHHLVFLYPAIMSVLAHFLKKKISFFFWMLFILGILLIGYHIPDPANPPTNPIVLSHSFLGALLLLYLLLRQLRT